MEGRVKLKTFILIIMKIYLTILSVLCFACTNTVHEKGETKTDSTKAHKSLSDSVNLKPEGRKLEKILYPNGKTKMEGNIENGLREGKWISWYENGMIWSETNFDKGVKNGPTTSYYPDGNKRYEGQYKNGKEFGKWIYYDKSGKVNSEKKFE